MTVHLIAAVGLSGQIGLNGMVPWHGDPRYAKETDCDLAEFARLTAGGILILGSVTAGSIRRQLEASGNREVWIWSRYSSAENTINMLLRKDRKRPLWICGGQKVYETFLPFVDWHHISVIPYDGPADRFMPPIIPGWCLTEGFGRRHAEIEADIERGARSPNAGSFKL